MLNAEMSTTTQETSPGLTITVTAETNAGGRRHMEDYIAVNLAPSEASFNDITYLREQAYIGVFDGHGGKEAAKCAREKLWDVIQKQPAFKSRDLMCVKESVAEAYVALHKEMEPDRVTWKRNKMGDLSTAGTTACTVIFRQDHIIVANVGDSTAVLAEVNPLAGQEGEHSIKAKPLTIDHKPEDPNEIARIEKQGGKVMLSRKGVPRVVWQRERKVKILQLQETTDGETTDGPASSTVFDTIPFLSVARSLGDFWSFSPATNEFVVSPCPDVHVLPLEPKNHKFLVLASDGLWNVMTPTDVVQFIWDYEHDEQTCHQPRDVVKAVINEALKRWKRKNLLADNISVLIAFLSEEEATPSTPVVIAPLTPTKVVEKVSVPSSSSNTSVEREEVIAAQPSTSSAPIECHVKSKQKRHKRVAPSRYRTTLNSCNKEEINLRKRKRAKCEELEISTTTKRSKLDTDSGLELDSPTEAPPAGLCETESGSKMKCMEEESGVSLDNSEPKGIPEHDALGSLPAVLDCAT